MRQKLEGEWVFYLDLISIIVFVILFCCFSEVLVTDQVCK